MSLVNKGTYRGSQMQVAFEVSFHNILRRHSRVTGRGIAQRQG